MMRQLCAFLLLFVFAGPLAADEGGEYEVGQIWSFETDPADTGALIKIQAIEFIGPDEASMEVFHISMIGVNYSSIPGNDVVQHLPVSRETLDMSVTSIVSSDRDFPDHSEGVAMWREANGGVFTISLAEIAEVLRESYAQMQQEQAQNQPHAPN